MDGIVGEMKSDIRPLTEKEKLIYLKEFLESQIKAYQEDLEEVNVKIKRLEMNKDGNIFN